MISIPRPGNLYLRNTSPAPMRSNTTPTARTGTPAGGAGLLASLGLGWYVLKMLLLSAVIVLIETTNAKMRLFRVPEMLAVAFTLGALALVATFLF